MRTDEVREVVEGAQAPVPRGAVGRGSFWSRRFLCACVGGTYVGVCMCAVCVRVYGYRCVGVSVSLCVCHQCAYICVYVCMSVTSVCVCR